MIFMRWVFVGVALSAVLAGCGESKQTIEVTYSRPATYSIPDNVRTLAVSDFGGQTEQDRRWADLASDKLASDLQGASQDFSRFTLIDRKNLKKMMDEQDLQIAMGSDPEAANKAGKAANAQAIIYGNVIVACRDEQVMKTVVDPLNRSTRQVPTTHRYCKVTITFTMNDPFTSRTLATKAVTKEYDSAKSGKKSGFSQAGALMGVGGSDAMAEEEAFNKLVGECVDEFVVMISPHYARYPVELQNGKSSLVKTANKLAGAEDYEGALRLYQQALEVKPNDDGAAFNAGVMNEKLGNYTEAERMYARAFSLKDKETYVVSRQRVLAEMKDK